MCVDGSPGGGETEEGGSINIGPDVRSEFILFYSLAIFGVRDLNFDVYFQHIRLVNPLEVLFSLLECFFCWTMLLDGIITIMSICLESLKDWKKVFLRIQIFYLYFCQRHPNLIM